MLAPICLFTYNRLKETEQTLKALELNYLAKESDLFIFSDGPKNEVDSDKVESVRAFLRNISGFKSVSIQESDKNYGLADSIISGVSGVIPEFGKVIVLEDDLITSKNFLNFMNQALDYYNDDNKIFSISGYSMDLPSLKDNSNDYYLGVRASSWGWGTWENRWEDVDWEVKDFSKLVINPFFQFRFMRGGSDLPYMLWKQMNGKIDSWAIRWVYHQFKNERFTIFPSISKIRSIGFNDGATHTKNPQRFKTVIDEGGRTMFKFDENPQIDGRLVKEFKQKFSVWMRIKDKFIK